MKKLVITVLITSALLLGACESNPTCERELLSQVNAERIAAGVHPLVEDRSRYGVPLHWTIRMALEQNMRHNPNYGVELGVGVTTPTAGENAAHGSWEAFTAAWLASPRHRSNILDPRFQYTTLACVTDELGVEWVTQNFWG